MFDNPLLRRQIEKYLQREEEGMPEELRSLLEAVNQSYNSYEADRRLIERSMDLSSQELLEVSRTVQRQADRQRIALVKLREVLRALQLDEGGMLVGSGGLNRDEDDLLSIAEILKELVEQRNEAERKLQESEARFRLLAENSTDIIGRYDSEGYCLYVSPSCRSLTGYEPEELIGKHFTFGFRPDDHDQVANLRGVMLGASETVTFSYRFRRKDGRYIWLETAVHAIRDPGSGRIVESHTASRDVTSRKMAEEELRRLSIVASRTDNGVIITDSGFRVEWVNESFSRING